MNATLEVYDKENGGYLDGEEATVEIETDKAQARMTVEGPSGMYYDIGAEVRDGELLLVVTTTEESSQEGTPRFGDSLLQLFIREDHAEVENSVSGRVEIFKQR